MATASTTSFVLKNVGLVAIGDMNVTTVSNQNDTATLKVTASAYLTESWIEATGIVAKFYSNGVWWKSLTILGNGTRYDAPTKKTVTITDDWLKEHGSRTVKIEIAFHEYVSGVDKGERLRLSKNVILKPKTSYSVSFNANGGSGAPSSQKKWYGETLTLSSTKPTRTGYSLSNWNTSSSGSGTSYSPGASYTTNAALSLYAKWTANKYTISFNANGGLGAPSSVTKTHDVTLTLPTTKPTKQNYIFQGWSTSSTATTAEYSAGGSFTANAATTLYAVWKADYWNPRISAFYVNRCDSTGESDDYGTYVKVRFNFECCQVLGTNEVSSIELKYKLKSSSTWITTTSAENGTSGNVIEVIGGGNITVDGTYDIRVVVTDSQDGSSYLEKTISGAKFPIDIKSGGTGVAIGKPATLSNTFDVGFNTKITGNDGTNTTTLIVGDADNTSGCVYCQGGGNRLWMNSNSDGVALRYSMSDEPNATRTLLSKTPTGGYLASYNYPLTAAYVESIGTLNYPSNYVYTNNLGSKGAKVSNAYITDAYVKKLYLGGNTEDVGTMISNSTGTAKSIATATWTSLISISLTPGKWIVCGTAFYDSNATGRRSAAICYNGSRNYYSTCTMTANSGGVTVQTMTVMNLASTGTVDIRGWQNSGAALDVNSVYLRAIRLV